MKRLVIFDLDGTLADSLTSISFCMNRVLEEHGFQTFVKDDYRYFVGDGADVLVKRALHAAGDTNLDSYDFVKAGYDTVFKEYCMYEVKPYEGITETLNQLKEDNYLLAVLSNKPHERTIEVIHTLFGEELFDAVWGQKENVPRKPSPDGVYGIADELGITLDEIVYVGDTKTDMMTGKGAQVTTIGVLWGFRDREELEEYHADRIISKPKELLEIIRTF